MHTIVGVPFFIFLIHQNVCLGCGEVMHIDWWVHSSIKKPCGNEKGKGGNWITTTLFLMIYKVSS
jgi:hypothetical protein